MLKYTGHPLVDVGVATITAFVDKRNPDELTEADLDKVADYITREYVQDPLKSFLTVAFPNSGFTQPAYNKMPEKRSVYATRVLRNYSDETPLLDNEMCVSLANLLWLLRLVKKKACHKDALFANTFHCSPVRILSTSTLMVRQACLFQEKHCSLFKRFHLDVRSLRDGCLRCIRITTGLCCICPVVSRKKSESHCSCPSGGQQENGRTTSLSWHTVNQHAPSS